MTPAEYHARVLADISRELGIGAPEEPAPQPTGHYFVEVDEFGWEIDVGYRWSRESSEDGVEVEILTATLYTQPGTYEIGTQAFTDVLLSVWRDEIAAEIEAKLAEEAAERHPSACRCRDCRDALGDWQYHNRLDQRGTT